MTQEKVRYIIDYFLRVLPDDERLSIFYVLNRLKSNNDFLPFFTIKDTLIKRGFINPDQDLNELHRQGHEAFKERVAAYILKNYADKVYFNNCPECHQLARTPLCTSMQILWACLALKVRGSVVGVHCGK